MAQRTLLRMKSSKPRNGTFELIKARLDHKIGVVGKIGKPLGRSLESLSFSLLKLRTKPTRGTHRRKEANSDIQIVNERFIYSKSLFGVVSLVRGVSCIVPSTFRNCYTKHTRPSEPQSVS